MILWSLPAWYFEIETSRNDNEPVVGVFRQSLVGKHFGDNAPVHFEFLLLSI